MKRMLVIALAVALSACGAAGQAVHSAGDLVVTAADAGALPPPAVAADKVTLDETLLLRLERVYKATRTAAEMAVDAGLVRGTFAARVAEGDNAAFGLLGRARAAYDAGNAATYREALRQAEKAIAGIWGDSS